MLFSDAGDGWMAMPTGADLMAQAKKEVTMLSIGSLLAQYWLDDES